MPIYRYKCSSCIIEFEKIMSMRMAEATKKRLNNNDIQCPACGCVEVTPLLPHTSFSLKGGGWYKDGYEKDKR